MRQALYSILILLFLCSCSEDRDTDKNTESMVADVSIITPLPKVGCASCHEHALDANHNFSCTKCHLGSDDTAEKSVAHKGLLSQPAHPDNMMRICGECHRSLVEDNAHSEHFTLHNAVNMVREAFGAEQQIATLLDIPVADNPQTSLQLADDLLRRRCLRCHPYYSGDRYPAVVRGTGCASCHLHFYKGKLVSHSFLKFPGDSQCLQCHYGNWVGSDYYGRYDHDMNEEYRTPYTTSQEYFRPYGIEYHQLSTDVHQQHGMVCVDCHTGKELMAQTDHSIRCEDCHDSDSLANKPPANIVFNKESKQFIFTSTPTGKSMPVPVMQHPAHAKYNSSVGCQVCHAQWAFDDRGTHLLRNDLDEYDDFSRLTVQGSFEVEKILKNNLDFDLEEIPHVMTDKINGEPKPGLWYKGYETRRWENITIGPDSTGKLQVMRPLLDISLSWLDEDEEVRFDTSRANSENKGFVPYIPHTTGEAGIFYLERLKVLSQKENDSEK